MLTLRHMHKRARCQGQEVGGRIGVCQDPCDPHVPIELSKPEQQFLSLIKPSHSPVQMLCLACVRHTAWPGGDGTMQPHSRLSAGPHSLAASRPLVLLLTVLATHCLAEGP